MRYFSNIAQAATLSNSGGIATGTTTLVLSTTNGLPTSFPFTLRIDPDTANEELVSVSSGAGTVGNPYVITRGYDGTTAKSHTQGAPVVHSGSAADLYIPQLHIANSTPGDVHGLPESAWFERKTVFKSSDQGYNNDITLNDDLDLKITLDINTVYEVRLVLAATGAGGNLKTAWQVPAGWSGVKNVIGPAENQNNRDSSLMRTGIHQYSTEVKYGLGNSGAYAGMQEFSILTTNSTPGQLVIQHAQATSSADVTTVRAASYLVVTRISV